MPVFLRRATRPPGKKYPDFRQEVREDFTHCCAYCLLSERAASGREGFELDHFKPKSRPEFSHLEHDFFNLYYACHVCNHTKNRSWPSQELIDRGFFFVDFCRDVFRQHFTARPGGVWEAATNAGRYTEARLRLNRSHLVEVRDLLDKIADRRGMPRIDWNQPARDPILELLDGQ
jgi:hypothetical protein